MNSRALRRLAAEHASLRNEPLPPNYLFHPSGEDTDDLNELNILLAGPSHTPFAKGVFKLHLDIPPNYPQQPPTAHFRTPIFHPNVEPDTGGVCVETLKRDWDVKLTLRDILLVIGCLLIQPNPDSALNAEAGALIQSNYESYARRAELMTSVHAGIPRAWASLVKEAQSRGDNDTQDIAEGLEAAPPRRRRPVTRNRRDLLSRRSETSPSAALGRRRQPAASAPSFTSTRRDDDVFGARRTSIVDVSEADDDTVKTHETDSIHEDNQENDELLSPFKARTPPRLSTPRRPHGAAVPLGELTLEDASDVDNNGSTSSSDMEPEYPPSPRKSPSKSPSKSATKQRSALLTVERPESSRDAIARNRNITPNNIFDQPLAADSPYAATQECSPSPRKSRVQRPLAFIEQGTSGPSRALFAPPATRARYQQTPSFAAASSSPPVTFTPAGISKRRSPSSAERRQSEERRRTSLEAHLWELCGQDTARWNRGDFDGEPFSKKVDRW